MKNLTEERDFVYTFYSKNLKSTVTVPVTIPLSTSVSEFVGRLVNAHNLPCYVEDGETHDSPGATVLGNTLIIADS